MPKTKYMKPVAREIGWIYVVGSEKAYIPSLKILRELGIYDSVKEHDICHPR